MNWVHSDQKLSSSAIIIIYSDFEGTNKNLIDETSEI